MAAQEIILDPPLDFWWKSLHKSGGYNVSSRMKKKDCLACRITGTAAGVGTAGYLLYETRRAKSRSHKVSLLALAAVTGSAGLYRFFM
jgi:hypothetical protein